jgi:hypothetical protein
VPRSVSVQSFSRASGSAAESAATTSRVPSGDQSRWRTADPGGNGLRKRGSLRSAFITRICGSGTGGSGNTKRVQKAAGAQAMRSPAGDQRASMQPVTYAV